MPKDSSALPAVLYVLLSRFDSKHLLTRRALQQSPGLTQIFLDGDRGNSSPDSQSRLGVGSIGGLWRRRLDQKRSKSKRYYERKKRQRLLIVTVLSQFRHTLDVLYAEGCADVEAWQETDTVLSVAPVFGDGGNLWPKSTETGTASSSDAMLDLKKRRKLHWDKQKQYEEHNFDKLCKIALLLAAFLSRAATPSLSPPPLTQKMNQIKTHTQQRLLSTWMSLQPHWSELDANEKRLSSRRRGTPISELNVLLTQSAALLPALRPGQYKDLELQRF